MIDWTVNLGHIIAAVGFVVGGMGAVWALRADIRVLATRVSSLEASYLKIADVLVRIGRQEERILGVERRVERLEG